MRQAARGGLTNTTQKGTLHFVAWGRAVKFALHLFLVGAFFSAASAFEQTPYLNDLAEFYLRSSYSYRYYPDVEGGVNPDKYASHDHLVEMNLGVRFLPRWEIQVEVDCAATREMNFGLRRTGAQVRYLVFDDLEGDLVALAVGAALFYVPTRNLRDVSSPYHAQGNGELGASLGKEVRHWKEGCARLYAFFGVGTGNRGFPWLRGLMVATGQWKNRHRLRLFAEGYFGLGNQDHIDVAHFNGYAKIQHHSVDVGTSYHYLFRVWGSLGVKYAYRVYAHAFPERAHTATLEYCLPFSVF